MQRLPKRLVDGSQLTTSAATYYTTPAGTITTISACTVTNTTAGVVTASVHLVPSGGSATASNIVLSARGIAAGESFNVGSAIGQSLATGGTLQALASAGASINLVASGYETNP
jgi:predicted phage tail protein